MHKRVTRSTRKAFRENCSAPSEDRTKKKSNAFQKKQRVADSEVTKLSSTVMIEKQAIISASPSSPAQVNRCTRRNPDDLLKENNQNKLRQNVCPIRFKKAGNEPPKCVRSVQKTSLQSWLHSSDVSDGKNVVVPIKRRSKTKNTVIDLQHCIDNEHRSNPTCSKTESVLLESGQRISPNASFHGDSAPCGSDTSTPLSTPLSSNVIEDLFGFEKLLPPSLDKKILDCSFSPIVVTQPDSKPGLKNKMTKTTSTKKNKTHIPSIFFDKPAKVSKSYSKRLPPDRAAKPIADKTTGPNTEINIFDVSTLSSVESAARQHSCELSRETLQEKKTKRKTKRKNVVLFQEPDIPWNEINNHELVIESA